MKKIFVKIRDLAEGKLRGLCAGLSPEKRVITIVVLAVLFGCNLCYATPVAYQTNMMIMSEGNYNFGDYVRTGVPLVVLMVVTLSILLALRYGM